MSYLLDFYRRLDYVVLCTMSSWVTDLLSKRNTDNCYQSTVTVHFTGSWEGSWRRFIVARFACEGLPQKIYYISRISAISKLSKTVCTFKSVI